MRSLEGKHVEMAIRVEPKDRTLPQNSKLHVMAKTICAYNGDTLEDLKAQAVLEALGPEDALRRVHVRGEEMWIVRGTSALKKDECSKVMDWMMDKLAFCEIPEPKWSEIEVMP